MKTLTPPVRLREVAAVALLGSLAGCDPNAAQANGQLAPPAPETLLARTQADAAEAERRAALANQQAREARTRLDKLGPAGLPVHPESPPPPPTRER